MEYGTILGNVDPIAAKHGLPPLGEPRLLCQLHQQANRLVRRPVLRIVEVEAGTFGRETLATRRVVGEQLTEAEIVDLRVVALERAPRRTLAEWCSRGSSRRHRPSPPTPVSASLCLSMIFRRSFHASTKLVAASDWSFA